VNVVGSALLSTEKKYYPSNVCFPRDCWFWNQTDFADCWAFGAFVGQNAIFLYEGPKDMFSFPLKGNPSQSGSERVVVLAAAFVDTHKAPKAKAQANKSSRQSALLKFCLCEQ
jgi:hypothetical protein